MVFCHIPVLSLLHIRQELKARLWTYICFRARDSVKMCVKHGVDVIFHASWTDDEGMNMLEANKHKHVVAPAINWLYATLYESEFYGYAMSEAERDGYKREFANAKIVLKEMHRRGITVLP